MNTLFKEEAIPFIQLEPDNKEYSINEEAFEFIRSIDSPIGIISVVGMYRTGKSYLMNRMILNRQTGFGVGNTVNAHTKGLWIWKTPIPGTSSNGEPISVLVVDSEGLGAIDEDKNHDITIFTLSLLLSSSFIYNSVGSIDEQALQHLNLVVNLTKHISLKSKSSYEDTDPEEYSVNFPSFMWIVRDFTLQLLDDEGEPIADKDYLEKALNLQKGFSDNIEQKNRIRRLLKSFFKDRDCCTLVRPLTDESNLQNLEKTEMKDLRPEFVEQVIQLRRKIINKIKPMTMNGKLLNGEMICNLAYNYVSAINKGIVPNIENAWTYICKTESLKAEHQALEKYDITLKESIYSKFPMDEEDLIMFHKDSKKQCCEVFDKKALGPNSAEYIKDLKQKVKNKLKSVMNENEKETRKACQMFLANSYSGTLSKLKQNEFENFVEYEKELRLFQQYFIENGPPGPNRKSIMLDFCQKCLIEASDYFTKTLRNKLELDKALADENINRMTKEIDELKEESIRVSYSYLSKIRMLENQKAELLAREQGLRENVASLIKDKDFSEKSLKEKIDLEKKQFQKASKELNDKLNEKENKVLELGNSITLMKSEYDKEKALLTQKVGFIEKQLEDTKKKEKEYCNELKQIKNESTTTLKDANSKYETIIRELNLKINSLLERISDLDNEKTNFQQLSEKNKSLLGDKEKEFSDKIVAFQRTIQEIKMNENVILKKHQAELLSLQSSHQVELEQSIKKISNLELTLKANEELYKTDKAKLEKLIAMAVQKHEFVELQLKEAKQQLEESKLSHHTVVSALEKNSNFENISEAAKQIEELKEVHTKEIKELEMNFETIKSRLTSQIDQLTEKSSELEMKLKFEVLEKDEEIKNLREEGLNLKNSLNQISEQYKNVDSQKISLIEESEKRHKEEIKSLEEQLEEKEKNAQKEISSIQTSSEESLSQLKNFYEMEKERLEHKIIEEKEKLEKRFNIQIEEYEEKLKEEQTQHSDEIMALQDELRECEVQHQNIITQIEQENRLIRQKNEYLEDQLKELKDNLNKIQNNNSLSFEQQAQAFALERTSLLEKIEKLTTELTTKERVVTTLENKLQNFSEDNARTLKSIEENRNELMSERSILLEKLENQKRALQQANDELMIKKLEYNRESALSKQQIDFQNKRLTELQNQIQDINMQNDEKISSLKQEYAAQQKELIEKYTSEKDVLEQKYEIKRKALKESEANSNKQILVLDKEKTILAEKLEALEEKKNEIEFHYQEEIKAYESKLACYKDAETTGESALRSDVESYKKRLSDVEKEYNELKNNFEKEKALWEGKFTFLDQQKDQAKSSLDESTKKFEQTIDQIQHRTIQEKERLETNQQSLLNSLEQRHKSEIKEVNQAHQQIVNEFMQKTKILEKEIKTYQDKLNQEQKGKIGEQGNLEKKVAELLDINIKQTKEIDDLKAERDRKLLDNSKGNDKEKETLKGKLSDIEDKFKESEKKRTNMLFEFEKERAKWALERDHLIGQKNEALENIERMEKKKEMLLRENEKLKSEKMARRPTFAGASSQLSNSRFGMNTNKYLPSKFAADCKEDTIPSIEDNGKSSNFVNSISSKHSGTSKKSEDTPIEK